MSQFQGINIEGPRAVLNPSQPAVYQEGQVYLPKPMVTVGYRGFDYGDLGKAGYELGREIIEGYNQEKLNSSASQLESLQSKLAKNIELYTSTNQYEKARQELETYKSGAKQLMGFDPDDETTQGMIGPYGKLGSSSRSFVAEVEANIAKTERGWSDEIEFDNYSSFSQNEEKSFLDAEDKKAELDERIKRLESLFKSQTNTDITEQLPKSGFTVDRRRLFTKMQKDYIDLLEFREKLNTGKPEVEVLGDTLRDRMRLAASLFKQAKTLAGEISKITGKADPLTAEEKIFVEGLKARAAANMTAGLEIRRQGMLKLTEVIKKTIISNAPKSEPLTSEEKEAIDPFRLESGDMLDFEAEDKEILKASLKRIEDPFSLETLNTVIESGISSEATTAFLDAYESEQEVETTSIGENLKYIRALRTEQEVKLKNNIDLRISQANAELARIDSILKTEKNESKRTVLKQQKIAVVFNLEKTIRENEILPTLSKSIQEKSPVLHEIITRKAKPINTEEDRDAILNAFRINDSPSMGFSLDFDVDSRNIVAAAYGDMPNETVGVFDYAIKELNSLKAKFFDSPGGYESAAKSQDIKKYIAIAMGEMTGKPATSEEQHEAAAYLATLRLSQDGILDPSKSGISLAEATEILTTNKDSSNFVGNSVPFGVNQFVLTPWFQEMLIEADKKNSPEEAKTYIQETLDLFVTGANGMPGKYTDWRPVGADSITTTTHADAIDIVTTYIVNPNSNQELNAMYLMLFPKNIRTKILEQAQTTVASTTDYAFKSQHIANINLLRFISDGYTEQQSASNYLDSIKITKLTPQVVKDITENVSYITKFSIETERKQEIEKLRKSNSPVDKAQGQLLDFYFKNLVPAMSTGLSMPGWTPEISSKLANQMLLEENLRPLMIKHLLLNSNRDATTGVYVYDSTKLSDIVRAVNEDLNGSGMVFETDGFKNDRTKKVELPNGSTKTSIPDSVISAEFNMPVPEELKAMAAGIAGTFSYDENITETGLKIHLSQVADSRGATRQHYDSLKQDPYGGLIAYGVVKNRTISERTLSQLSSDDRSQANVIRELVAASIDPSKKDNLGVLVSSAAISLLPPETTDMEEAKTTVEQTAKQIRQAIVDGNTSNYSLDIISSPSNDGFGQNRPTLVIRSQNKIISSFQLADSSYSLNNNQPADVMLDLLKIEDSTSFTKAYDIFKKEKPEAQVDVRRKLAMAYLKKNPEDIVPGSALIPYGYGFSKQIFYKTRINKKGETEIIETFALIPLRGQTQFYDESAKVIGIIPKIPVQKTETPPSLPIFSVSTDQNVNFEDNNKPNPLLNLKLTKKEKPIDSGYFGILRTDNGNMVSEYKMVTTIDGKEIEIPTLVPTLTNAEILEVLQAADNQEIPSDTIVIKAIEFAKDRIRRNKSVFYDPNLAEDRIFDIQRDMAETESILEIALQDMDPKYKFLLLNKSGETKDSKPVENKPTYRLPKDMERNKSRTIENLPLDYVASTLEEERQEELVENPKFFDIGKALFRDFPPFFTK